LSRFRAKKSGDIVITADRSPRFLMSAQTSGIPSSHGQRPNTSATAGCVRFFHSLWIAVAKFRDLGNSPGRVAAVTLHMKEQLIDVRQI
jgi:hypothetical protein